jgi:formylglycine-generating enzyme required for sulfatase activity
MAGDGARERAGLTGGQAVAASAGAPADRDVPASFVGLPGGRFAMGDDSPWSYPADGEGPVREVNVAGFAVDPHAVSNSRFGEFVEATGHVTDAEKFGWSFVFAGLLPDDFPDTRGVAEAPWWRQVVGADWRHPEGPGSTTADRGDHPVVHVSRRDAAAFATWTGGRLPSEAEWEYAARAGSSTTFPWGEDLEPEGRHVVNVWQGRFPATNSCDDGWYGTCPVDEFPPNAFGLFNMIGNVWEWTASVEPGVPDVGILKGGSYLCHASYCRRYRPAARSRTSINGSLGNTGFRCVADLPSTGHRGR